MADHLQSYHHRLLTTSRLEGAYRQLLDMLAEFEIAATFAFVMTFTLSREERERFPVLDRVRNGSDPWLKHYWRCLDAGLDEGWHEPGLLEMVRDSGQHEIACHGFCHRPLGNASIDPAGARAELEDALSAARAKNIELKTLVFPRNEVGNLEAVKAAGFIGYRGRLNRPTGKTGKALALLEEFAIRPSPQRPARTNGVPVAIPSGRFFNWRFGARRLVPRAVTELRWRNQLRACASDGGVVHLWLHPHNLVTGPETAPVLANVLALVRELRDRGQIEVMSQRAYCERLASS